MVKIDLGLVHFGYKKNLLLLIHKYSLHINFRGIRGYRGTTKLNVQQSISVIRDIASQSVKPFKLEKQQFNSLTEQTKNEKQISNHKKRIDNWVVLTYVGFFQRYFHVVLNNSL